MTPNQALQLTQQAQTDALDVIIDGMDRRARFHDDRAIGAENEVLERRLKKIARQFGVTAATEERLRITEKRTRGGWHHTSDTRAHLSAVHTKHGKHRSRVYTAWRHMRGRCTRASHPDFDNYGGRGITVCERWLTFENFYADMGDPPSQLTLDRIDNDGNYEPGNCRWATRHEQRVNQRPAKRRVATHCARGHEFTEPNTIYERTRRKCRTCSLATRRARYERQRIQEVLLRAAPEPYDPDDLPDEGGAQ